MNLALKGRKKHGCRKSFEGVEFRPACGGVARSRKERTNFNLGGGWLGKDLGTDQTDSVPDYVGCRA